MEMNEILNGLNSCGCNDGATSQGSSQCIPSFDSCCGNGCGNGCGFGSWIWILLILFYSNGSCMWGNNGYGSGCGCGCESKNSCGCCCGNSYGNNNGSCSSYLFLLVILFLCAGCGFGGCGSDNGNLGNLFGCC